jgi:hypothetical protein
VTIPSRARVLRRTTATSAALVLALSLAACGGSDSDDKSDDTPSATTTEPTTQGTESSEPTTEATSEATSGSVPTEDELAAALLTAADVPADYTLTPAEDENDDNDTFEGTCLADVGKFSDALGFEPDSEAEAEFSTESKTAQGSVTSKVQAYADPAAVAPAFADFTDTVQTCTSVSTTDPDGVAIDLQISYDDTVDLPGAPFVSIVGVYALGEADPGVLDSIDQLATLQSGRVAELA